MLSVDKGTKNLDDNKEAVVTRPFSEKKVFTTEKVTTIQEVEKGTRKLEGMKESVIVICRKYSDKFDGYSKGSIVWFNIDHECFLRNFSTLEPEFNKKLH